MNYSAFNKNAFDCKAIWIFTFHFGWMTLQPKVFACAHGGSSSRMYFLLGAVTVSFILQSFLGEEGGEGNRLLIKPT